ncbi:hypothetical protein [Nitrosopumilus ureiphilus]|uniref:Uncharacterized protein n=1 Tax=Nitrosopumilus ureiphilus TaxID=1470067 RepID=A0A7D5M7H7_9ARCH|nr:hypothetical protein [Nitrosopumilus ureiphilus]QLH06328.1 hypothetical protein C5F50_03985 [Nitrosopumilus ureiphilus]
MNEFLQKHKDIFTISKTNNARFFDATKKISPKYHQSIVRLQQDYIDAWKTVINSAISLELEYANNAGFVPNVSESTLQTIHEMTELSIQAYLQQNKIIFDTVVTTKQAFATFNDTTKSFTSMNKEIMEFLMSMYEEKLKT